MLGVLFGLGIFNRITFIFFACPIGCSYLWITYLQKKSIANLIKPFLSVSIFTLLICLICVIIDSFYFQTLILYYNQHPIKFSFQSIHLIIPSLIDFSFVNRIQLKVFFLFFLFFKKKKIIENHKTNTIYEDSLIQKTFFFQFLNSYTSLFYIGNFIFFIVK